MSFISAIIPAGGYGLRLGKKTPKALLNIDNKPIIIHTLEIIDNHPKVDEIIVVVPLDYEELFKKKINSFNFKKIKAIVKGGPTRQVSVSNGLMAISDNSEWVLVHDGVRPFINLKLISKVIQEAKKNDGAVLGIPIDSTIKRIKENKNKLFIECTIERDKLWQIQTPQVFKKQLLLEAHRRFKNFSFTDDAALLEKLGSKIAIVEGSYFNIKITYPKDLILAKYILRLKKLYGRL